MGRALDLPQSDVLNFVDSPLGSFTLFEEWIEDGGEVKGVGGREWQLGLICKMRKNCFLKNN